MESSHMEHATHFDLIKLFTSSAMVVVLVCHACAVGRPNQTVSSVLGPHMARVAWTSALAAAFILCAAAGVALGAKRQPIPDDLRDVVDEEEDAEWRNWGASHSRGDGPPPDLSRMDPPALQAELLRGQTGPSFGFVKLRPGTPRCRVRIRRSPPWAAGSLPRLTMALQFCIVFSGGCGGDRDEVEQCAANRIGGGQIRGS